MTGSQLARYERLEAFTPNERAREQGNRDRIAGLLRTQLPFRRNSRKWDKVNAERRVAEVHNRRLFARREAILMERRRVIRERVEAASWIKPPGKSRASFFRHRDALAEALYDDPENCLLNDRDRRFKGRIERIRDKRLGDYFSAEVNMSHTAAERRAMVRAYREEAPK